MFGPQTVTVDGARFTTPTVDQYAPASYGQQTSSVPQVSPVMPPFLAGASGGGSTGVYEHVNGYGTSNNNNMVTAIAGQHPHSLKVSPVWWAVIALVVGLGLLNGTAWRKTVEEHADGGFKVGPAKGSASESA